RATLWWLASLKLLIGLLSSSPIAIPALPASGVSEMPLDPPPGNMSAPRTLIGPPPGTIQANHHVSMPPPDRHPSAPRPPIPGPARMPGVLLTGWVVGVVWGFGHTALRYRALKRFVKAAAPVDDETVLDQAGQIADRLGLKRTPQLKESASI